VRRAAAIGLLAPLGAFASASARAAGAPGFVPYDPSSEEQVSGALLLIAAYAVICGLLGLYALSLFLRTRALTSRARRLKERVLDRARGGDPPK
jgi:hypothetical protein